MTSIMARALASEYPYSPRLRALYKHPAMRARCVEIAASRDFEPGVDRPPDKALLVLIVSDARKRLRHRKVLHLEVIIEPHTFGWYALVEKPVPKEEGEA